MAKMDLTPLVVKAQAGDPDALNDLLGNCYEKLYYYAYNTVKNEDLSADVVQESCIEIMNTIKNLREPGAFMTWAGRIVAHQCTRYYRQTKDEVYLEENEDGETLLDRLPDENPGSLPEQVQEDKEFKKIMQQLLDSLPAEQRAALMLYYYENMSVGQIAEIQDVSDGTVKSRLNYGRKAVKAKVEDYEKKNGIKLHSIAPLPLLLYFLFRENMAQAVSSASAALGKVFASVTGSAGAGAAGAAAAATGAATTAATATTAAAVGTGIVTKIVAGIAAAVVTIGAVAGGIAIANNQNDAPAVTQAQREAVQMLSGSWYQNGEWYAEEPGFVLQEDGILNIDGQTHYLCRIDENWTAVDHTGHTYTQEGYVLYFTDQIEDFTFRENKQYTHSVIGQEPFSLIFQFRYNEDWAMIPDIFSYEAQAFRKNAEGDFIGAELYTRPGQIPGDETPPATEEADHGTMDDWRVHFGFWQSAFFPDQSFELREDGTLLHNSQTYTWTLENCYSWGGGAGYIEIRIGSELQFSLIFEQMPDGHYQCLMIGPDNYISTSEDGYFYRPADFEGYTVVPLTVDNVLDYVILENKAWFDSTNELYPPSFTSGYQLRFRDNLTGYCRADFLHYMLSREATVDMDAQEYTLGPVAGASLRKDTDGFTGDEELYYSVLTPVDSGLCGTASTEKSGSLRVHEEYLAGALSVQGFVLVPPEYTPQEPATEVPFTMNKLWGTWHKMPFSWNPVSETITVNPDGTIVIGDRTMRWTEIHNASVNDHWAFDFILDPESMGDLAIDGNCITFIHQNDGTFLVEFCQAHADGSGSSAFIYYKPECYTQIPLSTENVLDYMIIEPYHELYHDELGTYGMVGTIFLLKDHVGAISDIQLKLQLRCTTYQVTIDADTVTRTKLRDNGTAIVDLQVNADYFASETFLGEYPDYTGTGPYTMEVTYYEVLSVQEVSGELYLPVG